MNCEALDKVLIEMGHGLALQGDLAAHVEGHVRVCESCRERLDKARAVHAQLLALKSDLRELAPPEAIETRLRQAFRTQALSRQRARRASVWFRYAVPLSGIAAGVVLAMVVWTGKSDRAPPGAEATGGRFEVATAFFPVNGGAEAAMANARMLRIQAPRSTLMGFGLPVNPQRIHEPIDADVVVDGQGVVRAIRFVQ